MNSIMQSAALVEISLSCAVLIVLLGQKLSVKTWPIAIKVLLVIILANLFFWPFGQLPLAAYVRGFTGDMSVVSMLLLWSSLLAFIKPTPIGVKIAIGVLAIIFYPLALGLGMFDPYGWGYGSIPFLVAVLLAAIACSLANWNRGVWIAAIAMIAWSAHWHESANLWDYLLDPFLGIWAISASLKALYRKRRDKARSGYLFRPG
jgi:hypothetical protein